MLVLTWKTIGTYLMQLMNTEIKLNTGHPHLN